MSELRNACRAAVIVLCLVLATSPSCSTDGEDEILYRAHMVETDAALDAGMAGAPPQVRYSIDGTKVLVLGYAAAGEVRILDADLETIAILEPPSPGFTVKGAEMDHRGRHAYLWGRAPGATNDTAIAYSLGNFSLLPDFLPEDLPPLVEIDYLKPMTDDNFVLAMAGRDINGTSRLAVFERESGGIRTDDAIEGGGTVLYIGSDGHDMLVLSDDSRLHVYETWSWQLNTTAQISPEEITYWHIWYGDSWTFGDAAGRAYFFHDLVNVTAATTKAARGPVRGVQYGQKVHSAFLVVAIPGKRGGSSLELMEGSRQEFSRYSSHPTEKVIAWMYHVPGEDHTFAVVFEDGSMNYYRMEFTEWDPPFEDERGMGLSFWASMVLIAILVPLIVARTLRKVRPKTR